MQTPRDVLEDILQPGHATLRIEDTSVEFPSPLQRLQEALRDGRLTPLDIARECLLRSNGSASRNTYLWQDEAALLEEAEALPQRYPDPLQRPPMYGVPVSLKDCFDIRGTVTTMGSRYVAQRRSAAQADSAMLQRLRSLGCLVTGKTHLHPLAWGITGENADYRDSVQPRDAASLTGGSSSGGAASVQEGSALFAVGTDTGGSIRVPAALSGMVGFRASHGIAAKGGAWPGMWQGCGPLAQSFDTAGILLRDARDLPAIAGPLFGLAPAEMRGPVRVGIASDAWIHGCDAAVVAATHAWQAELRRQGHVLETIDASVWDQSVDVFATLQAYEAAALYQDLPPGDEEQFGTLIAQRMRWGWSLSAVEVQEARERVARFRAGMSKLFRRVDLLLLPCAPVAKLTAGSDLSRVRPAILRYTAPFSLAGVPAVALPGELLDANAYRGTGVQIAAAAGNDAALLSVAAQLCRLVGRPARDA